MQRSIYVVKVNTQYTFDLNMIVPSGLYKIYKDINLHVLSVCRSFPSKQMHLKVVVNTQVTQAVTSNNSYMYVTRRLRNSLFVLVCLTVCIQSVSKI